MSRYNPQELEPKWQKSWADKKLYEVDTSKPVNDKFYIIPMFPYPSGDMHIGHWYNFAPTDTVARWQRMRGRTVLHCNGYDSFGLPAENAAIKRGIPPAEWTSSNIASMGKQLAAIGASYDQTKKIITSEPSYYRWTQWLFLKLYEKGLAYKKKGVVNWCPKDQTVLANEQVVGDDNHCERCGTPVIQKELEQWYFKITDYADRLLEDFDKVDWPNRVQTMQANWIGKSVGAEVDFKTENNKKITVFTTRADTLFGATYLVLAPEHHLVEKLTTKEQKKIAEQYVQQATSKTELERKEGEKDKTGVFTGSYAINPVNNEKIPIWIADYVLTGYGTGAIMAVPAHDQRDYDFAIKHALPIKEVVEARTYDKDNPPRDDKEFTTRHAVVCLVKRADGTYLTLKYRKLDWHAFVIGGVENNEDIVDTAKRELKEETGYVDVTYEGRMPFALNSIFYAEHKDVNRDIRADVLLFKLNSDKQVKTAREAHEDFDEAWVPLSELHKLHPVGGLEYMIKWLQEGDYVYTGEGRVINSGDYTNLLTNEVREAIISDLAKQGVAKEKVNYKMRDWLISRQRYWGTPIPIIYCEDCGTVTVPEDLLPVVLPENVQFEPTGTSPLQKDESFLHTECPKCHKPARRETDTMDTFIDSSWYFLRYPDIDNKAAAFDPKILENWGPVDHYIGGIEHAILHLLYARFITKFLYDNHGLRFDEPFAKLSNQGMILGPDGLKMSKSKGNVVNPDEMVTSYGADSLRLYLMFMGPYDQGGPYSMTGIAGTRRFLERLWLLINEYTDGSQDKTKNQALRRLSHKTIKIVSGDLQTMSFNTAIAAMMSMVNELYKIRGDKSVQKSADWQFALQTLAQLLAPFAPHITEEMWQMLGGDNSIHLSNWPVHDEKFIVEDSITIIVQVNGKLRAQLSLPAGVDEHTVTKAAKSDTKVATYLQGKTVKKVIYIPGKLVNIVI